MNLKVFIATVFFAECYVHGSRIANNVPASEIQTELSLLKSRETEEPNRNIPINMTQQTSISNVSTEFSSTNNDIDKANLVPKTLDEVRITNEEMPRKDNAINSFAQRLGHNIFHITPRDSPPNPNKTHEDILKTPTLIWSPMSVYQALLPVFYGADGETKKELGQLLLSKKSNDSNEPPYLNLSDLNATNSSKVFSSVTGLFTRNGMSLNPYYVQQVEKELKFVEVKTADFGDAAEATKNINMWVNDSTQGLIKEAIDETQINPEMFMLLVNCVRFKASWKTRFNEKLTKVSNFNGVNGVQRVQMMRQIGTMKFAKFPLRESYSNNGAGVPFSVLEMPYAEDEFVSLFILPDTTEKLQDTMNYVSKVGVTEIRQSLHDWDVELLLPKFRVKSDVNVEESLMKNGLTTLFDPVKANLNKLFATRSINVHNSTKNATLARSISVEDFASPPYLSNIIHRTIFETTEEGTTAAALTALSIVPLSALSQDRVYRVNLDRPFIVLLVKNDNTVVFQGMISDLIGQEIDVADTMGKNAVAKKESTSVPSRNSILLYPSDNEVKVELDKFINSNAEENREDSNELKKITIPTNKAFPQNLNSQSTEFNASESNEVRGWWTPKRIPDYLLPGKVPMNSTSSPNSTQVPIESNDKKVITHQKIEPVAGSPAIEEQIPSQFIQFTKYQQPEPKDPTGIRFPATFPMSRNKLVIKPRSQDHDNSKNDLLKWMSVY